MNKFNKPKRFYFIGWGWLLFASASLVDGVMDIANILGHTKRLESLIARPSPQYVNTVEFMAPIIQNINTLLFFKVFLFVLAIIAAANFLRLKEWASVLLEALSWFMVLLVLMAMFFAVLFANSVTADGHSLKWGLNFILVGLALFGMVFLFSALQLRKDAIGELFRANLQG